MRRPTTQLHGWGRTAPTASVVPTPPGSVDDLAALLDSSGDRGVVARGLGRSYGDAAQNAGGVVLDMTSMTQVHDLDLHAASVHVQAGVSIDSLLRMLMPFGLTVPVLPGTRQVTVGGAIACDVHGKNHHVNGSFGQHVLALDLMTADGTVRTLTAGGSQSDLFWATVGGMGLTGVIVSAVVSLRRVQTSFVVVRTQRAKSLDAVMSLLADVDQDDPYSVAWFDSVRQGRSMGRGVVMHGRDACRQDLPPHWLTRPLSLPTGRTVTVPDRLPSGLVNRVSGRAFNEVWFRKTPARAARSVVPSFGFFHPLDSVAEWNRIYGRRGFCQYQLVVPFGAEHVIEDVVQHIAATGHTSCLNVLKRLGPADPSPMSFPMAGWTLAVDLPVRAGLERLLAHLDELVTAAGGRVYLAKDSRLSPGTAAAMYPRLEEFRGVLDRVDPNRRFVSDLSRRLGW